MTGRMNEYCAGFIVAQVEFHHLVFKDVWAAAAGAPLLGEGVPPCPLLKLHGNLPQARGA